VTIHDTHPFLDPESERDPLRRFRGRLGGAVSLWTTGVGRDRMSLDGISPPPGLSEGVPGLSISRIRINEEKPRSVTAEFNGERIVVRSWPAQENHAVIAEFHY